jgi:hypothetical protein
LHGGSQLVLRSSDDRNAGTGLMQPDRDFEADAARSADYEGGLARQREPFRVGGHDAAFAMPIAR